MAGDASGAALQEAAALPQPQCVVGEAAGAAVGPVGGVLVGGLIVFQNRQEVIVVILAGGIAGNKDIAEGVALGADHGVAGGVEAGLNHHVAASGRRVWMGLREARHMFAAGAVTAFAVGAEVGPGSLVLNGLRVEVLLFLADVAGKAVFVPQLLLFLAALVGIADIEVVEPLFPEDIPTRRQHDDAAIRQGGQVMLDAAVSERVIDTVFDRLAGQIRFGNVINAGAQAQSVAETAEGDPAAREIALDCGSDSGLEHFAVAGVGPLAISL